eukprot:TRINITY_DN100169_c0_g1_i1.p1 TRINITY_DN100169_c0_g1~~TRINITY_DN100169_c0_g1_i1.p1  ORF type:complete len:103 (-),score=12.75 TRINITY_DN100169_c0_g1_i1:137-445(-)
MIIMGVDPFAKGIVLRAGDAIIAHVAVRRDLEEALGDRLLETFGFKPNDTPSVNVTEIDENSELQRKIQGYTTVYKYKGKSDTSVISTDDDAISYVSSVFLR